MVVLEALTFFRIDDVPGTSESYFGEIQISKKTQETVDHYDDDNNVAIVLGRDAIGSKNNHDQINACLRKETGVAGIEFRSDGPPILPGRTRDVD